MHVDVKELEKNLAHVCKKKGEVLLRLYFPEFYTSMIIFLSYSDHSVGKRIGGLIKTS